MDIVLIPAYEPDETLLDVLAALKEASLEALVVNDGSGPAFDPIFEKASETATVIALAQNSGKGAALRFGMNYIKTSRPDCDYVITCDADGQHLVTDVVRVSERLHGGADFVLTVRRRRHDIPFRSRFGNTMSRIIYTWLTNQYLSDNQSGLRGFAVKHLDWLLKVRQDGYDYEMNMLYAANKQGIRITTLPIEAVYIGNNESSHFKPVPDTIRIYRSLFGSAAAVFISFAVMEAALIALTFILGYSYLTVTIPSVAGLCCALRILIERFGTFRGMHYRDYYATLIYTVIYFTVYLLGCLVFSLALPGVPLVIAFNIVYILFMPLRYYMVKFMAIAGKTNT